MDWPTDWHSLKLLITCFCIVIYEITSAMCAIMQISFAWVICPFGWQYSPSHLKSFPFSQNTSCSECHTSEVMTKGFSSLFNNLENLLKSMNQCLWLVSKGSFWSFEDHVFCYWIDCYSKRYYRLCFGFKRSIFHGQYWVTRAAETFLFL